MENASKALIIAGAILLSILIIALGIYVFNMARSAVNTDMLSETEVQTFNTKITQYEGKVTGGEVKSLLDTLVANANSNKGAQDRLPTVTYYGDGGPTVAVGDGNVITPTAEDAKVGQLSKLRSAIVPSHYYYVASSVDNDTGLVHKIYIEYKAAGTQAQAAVAKDAEGETTGTGT